MFFPTPVLSKHSIPAHVTFYCSSEFVSHFFCSLGKALDMHLHFILGYHSKGDWQTKQMNQTLEQYLCIYCTYQKNNWMDILPLVEFAYNNMSSATTKVSPFFANKSYHPNILVHPECDLMSAQAREFAVNLDSLHEFLCEEMAAAQQHYQELADSCYILAPALKVDNLVYVKAKYFWSTWLSNKLSKKNLRPYPIIA